jgi:hypothetical protein
MPNRSRRQCRERYQNFLEPSLSTEEWSPEEDRLLTEHFLASGRRRVDLANPFPERSSVNLKNRWALLPPQTFVPTPVQNRCPQTPMRQSQRLHFGFSRFCKGKNEQCQWKGKRAMHNMIRLDGEFFSHQRRNRSLSITRFFQASAAEMFLRLNRVKEVQMLLHPPRDQHPGRGGRIPPAHESAGQSHRSRGAPA